MKTVHRRDGRGNRSRPRAHGEREPLPSVTASTSDGGRPAARPGTGTHLAAAALVRLEVHDGLGVAPRERVIRLLALHRLHLRQDENIDIKKRSLKISSKLRAHREAAARAGAGRSSAPGPWSLRPSQENLDPPKLLKISPPFSMFTVFRTSCKKRSQHKKT